MGSHIYNYVKTFVTCYYSIFVVWYIYLCFLNKKIKQTYSIYVFFLFAWTNTEIINNYMKNQNSHSKRFHCVNKYQLYIILSFGVMDIEMHILHLIWLETAKGFIVQHIQFLRMIQWVFYVENIKTKCWESDNFPRQQLANF